MSGNPGKRVARREESDEDMQYREAMGAEPYYRDRRVQQLRGGPRPQSLDMGTIDDRLNNPLGGRSLRRAGADDGKLPAYSSNRSSNRSSMGNDSFHTAEEGCSNRSSMYDRPPSEAVQRYSQLSEGAPRYQPSSNRSSQGSIWEEHEFEGPRGRAAPDPSYGQVRRSEGRRGPDNSPVAGPSSRRYEDARLNEHVAQTFADTDYQRDVQQQDEREWMGSSRRTQDNAGRASSGSRRPVRERPSGGPLSSHPPDGARRQPQETYEDISDHRAGPSRGRYTPRDYARLRRQRR